MVKIIYQFACRQYGSLERFVLIPLNWNHRKINILNDLINKQNQETKRTLEMLKKTLSNVRKDDPKGKQKSSMGRNSQMGLPVS